MSGQGIARCLENKNNDDISKVNNCIYFKRPIPGACSSGAYSTVAYWSGKSGD